MKQQSVKSIKQSSLFMPAMKVPSSLMASDREGHYDVDGVSFACGQIIIASDGKEILCFSKSKVDAKIQGPHENI